MFSTSLTTLRVQYLFLLFLGVPAPFLFNAHWKDDAEFRKTSVNPKDRFDFIVVGGGSAGLVVANRLSQHYRTLLLEAGGRPLPLTQVPGLAPPLLTHPDVDWVDTSVPQKYACHALENNVTLLSHGRGLGGSSMINFMMYMRGSPEDYNEWARVTKDPEWNYDNLLPLFKRMETYHGRFASDKLHGQAGAMNIDTSRFKPISFEWEKAMEELGFNLVDPNGYQSEGYFSVESNTINGSRHSTYSAYIEPILDRENLKIELYAHVTKIELDENNRAVGVHYVKDGKEHFVKAEKEIILSAGALGSPKILMLSGIGPADHLKSLGIQVKLDLPVGKNLQDHIMTYLGPFLVDPGHTVVPERDIGVSVFNQYLEYNKGILSGMALAGGAVVESSVAKKGWPDILLVGFPTGVGKSAVEDLHRAYGFKKETVSGYYKDHFGKDAFVLASVLGRPKGRGELWLRSTDPFEPPAVDPKYLHDPQDRKVIHEGVKLIRKMALETKAFKRIGAKLISNLLPGCEQHGSADSDEYWNCYVRHWSHTMWHYSCTCKMGSGPEDKNSVVDSKLRVHGTEGLRVIDSSIMPQVTNANTNFPAIVIGEKGADIILKHWMDVEKQKVAKKRKL